MGENKFVTASKYRPYQLQYKCLLEYAVRTFPKEEIVYRDGFRYTYKEFYKRLKRLANVLESLGIGKGDVVGTIDWNTHWHMELYNAIPCMGAILHPINPRLSYAHIEYIINHAEDKILFVGSDYLPIVESLQDKLKKIKCFVIIGEREIETKLKNAYFYEDLMKEASSDYEFPDLNEDTVFSICYTSGTTGLPKGAWFTHKQAVIHTLSWGTFLGSLYGLSSDDVILHIVPMYHVHSWGLPFIALVMGQKQVFPGRLTPEIVWKLIEKERVTYTSMVATVLRMLLDYPELEKCEISSLRHITIGGGPLPRGLLDEAKKKFKELGADVEIKNSSGMTEAFPILTISIIKKHLRDRSWDEKADLYRRAGIPGILVNLRVVDDELKDVPKDGKTVGKLVYQAPWITPGYLKNPEKSEEAWEEGWWHTGDLAVWDEEGYIDITDREKDIIKSGGEWISSLRLEELISTHPGVAEVCVVGLHHAKWQERPVALVVLRPEYRGKINEEDIKNYLVENFVPDKIPKWWLPDKIIFISEIPKTGVGKYDKKVIRDSYKDIFLQK